MFDTICPENQNLQNAWSVGLKLSLPQRPFCVLGEGEDGEREKERAGGRWVGELIIVIFN